MQWLNEAANAAAGRAALHVCGTLARSWLSHGDIDDLVGQVWRIQVNGRVNLPGLGERDIQDLCLKNRHNVIITQHSPGNDALLRVAAPNHAILMDASGGRGLAPVEWLRPNTFKAVGFAGGLGPETLVEQLPRIERAASGRAFWVDMEQALRTRDDWFDTDRADACIEAFHRWRQSQVGQVA